MLSPEKGATREAEITGTGWQSDGPPCRDQNTTLNWGSSGGDTQDGNPFGYHESVILGLRVCDRLLRESDRFFYLVLLPRSAPRLRASWRLRRVPLPGESILLPAP